MSSYLKICFKINFNACEIVLISNNFNFFMFEQVTNYVFKIYFFEIKNMFVYKFENNNEK